MRGTDHNTHSAFVKKEMTTRLNRMQNCQMKSTNLACRKQREDKDKNEFGLDERDRKKKKGREKSWGFKQSTRKTKSPVISRIHWIHVLIERSTHQLNTWGVIFKHKREMISIWYIYIFFLALHSKTWEKSYASSEGRCNYQRIIAITEKKYPRSCDSYEK